jgi:ring-1,2-phenylacetyl-CoA epoxidase subunit PaaD
MNATLTEVRNVVGQVTDPEIPVLTVADLGILRDVRVDAGGRIQVTITPTYSGCPAIETISRDIVQACARHGWHEVTVRKVLSPAWTTDWLTDDGKRKLREFGIAPPDRAARCGGPGTGPVPVPLSVRCPRCGSADTREASRFGSTACKALYVCTTCLEPFDYFKAL